jgi:ABC-2 type transport system ATP-binding protein
LTAPPIELRGLTKRFGDVLAVESLDLTVEEGQVVGLLGPNGAGKTTTLRALTGLIHPTSGEAHLFGETVRPGTPALQQVGALIESPGFVPHLTGLENLELFWEAGRPSRQPDLEGALAVADLGEAIDRKVKTYSHGMRQRLGIAQALLGNPELLVLDEPTSGLDPQQMREIRDLVRTIAGLGATVLLSSHLLGEVEQVCTHAAVLDRGHLVAAGTVDQLTGSASSMYLEVDDTAGAMAVIAGLDGVGRVTSEAPGLAVELGTLERKDVVRALVEAGIGVETAMSRHRLEDAFIKMLEEEPT